MGDCLPNGFRLICTRILRDCIYHNTKKTKKTKTKTKKTKRNEPSLPPLSQGHILHSIITAHGIDTDFFYGSQLIRFYSVFDHFHDARNTFYRLPNPNAFAWSEIISAHTKHGKPCDSIRLYRHMVLSGAHVDGHVMVSVLQACAQICCLKLGTFLHVDALARGLLHISIGLGLICNNTLVNMYATCGILDSTQMLKRDIFTDMDKKCGDGNGCNIMKRDVVMCNNTTIDMYAKCDNLNRTQKMQRDVVMCNNTSIDMYPKFGNLDAGQRMQSHVIMCNSPFINMYTPHANLDSTPIIDQDVAMCNNTCIDMYSKCSSMDGASQLYRQKMELNVVMCNNALIDMYAKCGSLDKATLVFNQMVQKDVVTWNTLITGLMDHGHVEFALLLFCHMLEERVEPDQVTFLALVRSAAYGNSYDLGTLMHCFVVEYAIDLLLKIGSALIDMYVANGSIYDAQKVFSDMPNRNVVTWTTMLSGYTQCGHSEHAFQVFHQMQQEGLHLDSIALVGILQACAATVGLDQGKAVHLYILDDCDEIDAMLGSALIDMYFKCGNMECASQVFTKLSSPSGIIWNAMINGYAQHGAHELAIQFFNNMKREGVLPDSATFISLFSACSHGGVLEDGLLHLQSMLDDYGLVLNLEHYMCLVDLLGRTGHVKDAESLLQTLPFSPCEVGWRSLMSHCRTLGDVVRGRRCFDHLVRINASEPTAYVLMAEIYGDAGMMEECEKMKRGVPIGTIF